MNRTLQLLLVSDLFFITGFGLIDPVLAIFVKDRVADGTIFAAGFAIALFLLTKAVVQLPFARWIENHSQSATRRVQFLILGGIFIVAVPLIYLQATDVRHVFLAQIIHGIGSGFAFPTWMSLWNAHLDKNKETSEWITYSSMLGIFTALAGFGGAWLAQLYGFRSTFVLVTALVLVGFLLLLGVEKKEVRSTMSSRRQALLHYHVRRKSEWQRR